MIRRHPNGREMTDEELEAQGEDARDAVDNEAADWLAEDEFRGRW